MNPVSLNLQNVTDDMSDWDAHWTAFSNVIQIYEAYKSNALTVRNCEQISVESLDDIVSTIIDKIKAFFSWLYEKIEAFVKWIGDKIKQLMAFIRRILFGEEKNGSLNTIIKDSFISHVPQGTMIKYDRDLELVIDNTVTIKGILGTYATRTVTQTDISDIKTKISNGFQDLQNSITNEVVRERSVRDLAKDFYQCAIESSYVEALTNYYCDLVTEIKERCKIAKNYNFTSDKILDQIFHLINPIFNLCKISDLYDELHTLSAAGTSTAENPSHLVTKALAICDKGLQWALYRSQYSTKLYNMIISFVADACKKFNAGAHAINYKVAIPDSVTAHMREHLQHSDLRIRYIVITNLVARDWKNFFNGNGVLFGYSLQTSINDVCYINLSALRHKEFEDQKKLTEADIEPLARHVLITILHEYKHISDAQHGVLTPDTYKRATDEAPGNDDETKYRNNKFEIAARAAGSSFEPTTTDLTWARSVMRDVLAQYQAGMSH